jgi:hypothetical protein
VSEFAGIRKFSYNTDFRNAFNRHNDIRIPVII